MDLLGLFDRPQDPILCNPRVGFERINQRISERNPKLPGTSTVLAVALPANQVMAATSASTHPQCLQQPCPSSVSCCLAATAAGSAGPCCTSTSPFPFKQPLMEQSCWNAQLLHGHPSAAAAAVAAAAGDTAAGHIAAAAVAAAIAGAAAPDAARPSSC